MARPALRVRLDWIETVVSLYRVVKARERVQGGGEERVADGLFRHGRHGLTSAPSI